MMFEETGHAKLSPSSSKRWINCPGSVAASEGLEDTAGFYAWEGTAAHEVLELCLQSWAASEDEEWDRPLDYVGHEVQVVTDYKTGKTVEIEVTEEMAEAVEVAFEYVVTQVNEAIQRTDFESVEVHFERRVNFERANPPEGLDGGTADITIWEHREDEWHLEVIDYKHGRGVLVEVEENTQAILYALGAILTDGRKAETVTTTIVQPRAYHDVGPIRSATYTWEDMLEWKDMLWAAAERTQDPDAELNPGDWCRFCLAAPTCPAKLAQANEVAAGVFELDVIKPEPLPAPEHLDTEQLAFIVTHAGDVMDWLRSVEAHVTSLLERGVEVPGFKLIEGRSNRQWVDNEAAECYLARHKLKKEERNNLKLISPAQAEKKLKAKGYDLSKLRLEQHITKPEGRPKLAPADHPKPALTPSVEAAFTLDDPNEDDDA